MATERVDDLLAFKGFLDEQLAGGGSLTPEEALFARELENQPDSERQATVAALRQALDDMNAGDTGIPVDEVVATRRRTHRLPDHP